MLTIVTLFGMMGFGGSYQGYDDGKYYFEIHSPDVEYGLIYDGREVYCDLIHYKG